MERKPQQQTLSIRISDTLRDFLEASQGVIAHARCESVSISDVAKLLLESARDDRLDFRWEVAELQRTQPNLSFASGESGSSGMRWREPSGSSSPSISGWRARRSPKTP